MLDDLPVVFPKEVCHPSCWKPTRRCYETGIVMKQKADVLQGTLALMVLKTLDVLGPLHGYGIARRIEQISGDLLAGNQGTLYPVLLKLEQEGAVASECGARLKEEIAEPIALQAEVALRAGLAPVEARRQAMLKFGGVEAIKQDYRAERGLVFIESLLGDLRNAGRTISRMPGLAAVIVVSLAIGIGVNTTILSWIQMILLQPLPGVSGASNFLLVEPRAETGGYPGASWLEYHALQTQVPALRDIVASQMVAFNVGEPGQTERTHGQLVSGNYFSAFFFQAEDGIRDYKVTGVQTCALPI